MIVCGVYLARYCFIDTMVFHAVDAEHKRLLEGPRSDICSKLFVSRLAATTFEAVMLTIRSNNRDVKPAHPGSSFWKNSSLNISTPPTHVALAPPTGWNPATKPIWLPAHKPSPPLSAASTTASAPESVSPSLAKLSAGAFRIGTRRGLFWYANGIPENHTGASFDETTLGVTGLTGTGITVAGSSRCGKWEMRGVPGGGRVRENSEASVYTGVCFGERAMRRLVFLERRETRD